MAEEEPGHVPEVKAIQQTRRLLANARERTRVHTISAAFEALRKQVTIFFRHFDLHSMLLISFSLVFFPTFSATIFHNFII